MNMSMDQLMETGRNIYLAQCAACHQPNGQGIPGVFPRLAGEGVSVGDRTQHIDIVVNGVSGTAMQSFQNSLSMSEIAAVITYERNAWGNDTGDAVQPADIHNFIQGNQ
nr:MULTISPECIES: cytochrome c [Gammaproteobacteria]